MAFTVDIKGNASHLDKTLKGVKTSLGSIGSVAGSVTTALAGMGAAGAAALGAFAISSSQKASAIESLTMQFETLLGSAENAGNRIAEITKFAASTPFEISELAATSKLLQTLGGTMLATGDGLRMVGDAAAIAGQPIQEVGLHIGRVFNAITSGTSAGESIARLQELGLMTGKVKLEFEALAAAQKKGKAPILSQGEAMAKLQDVFKATSGAMERLASTTEGKLSNMKDNFDQLQVAFGTGFNNGLRDALDATNNFLPQLQAKFTEAGEIVGSAISDAVAGDYERFALIGGVIGEAVVAGFKAVTISSLEGIGNSMLEHIAQAVENDPLLGGAPSLNDKGRGKNAFGDMIRENLTTAESSDNLAYRIAEELNKSEAPKMLQQLQELNRTGKSQLEKLEKLKQFQNAKFTN
jgi:hypothetical protein